MRFCTPFAREFNLLPGFITDLNLEDKEKEIFVGTISKIHDALLKRAAKDRK